MSIKFKQNGQWVKIPTPSQIDDSAASAATTYSSNKINEIIPQNIAKYLLEHKDELGTDDFTKLKNTPYTLIGKSDTKFSSIDTMYSYDAESSSPKQNVDNGLYLLKEDIDFSAEHTMNFYEYVLLSMSNSEEMPSTNRWEFTIPKGSTLSVQDDVVTIVCPRSIDYTIKYASGGSSGDGARSFAFGVLNGEGTVPSLCLAKDGIESSYTYYDAILYGIFSNVEKFSEGQPIVTANSYQGSGSMPLFKLGEAGATTTSITDDNYTNYTTTEKLAKLTAGLYYVNTDKLSINLKGIDVKSQISTLFPQTNVNENIDVEKGSQITVTSKQTGSPEIGYQTQKLVNIYNTIQGLGYPYSVFFLDAENSPSTALVSMGIDLINKALSNAYSATNQISEIMNTCITDESLRGKVPVISAPDAQTATGVKNVFKAMDFPKGVPITVINNENAINYNTLDKLCHLDDGLYLCKDTYKANQDYIVDVTFKGIDLLQSVGGVFGGTEPTPENTTVRCKNGCLISVSTITSVHKNIRITQSAESISNDNNFCGDIYISAQADSGDTKNPVYGVTGDSVNYIRPFNYNSLLNTYFPSAVLKNAFGAESQYLNGKLAKWETAGDGVVLTGVDIKESPIIEVNDSNWSNFDTLQKWMSANAGTYLVKTTKLTVNAAGIDQTKSSDNSFSRLLSIPSDTYIYVYSTDDSNSSATNYKNVVFQKADNMPSGYYGEWMTFKWDTRKTYSADNVELYPLMTSAMNGAAAIDMVMLIFNLIADLSETDAGKVVKIASDGADSYKFQAADITLIVESTAVTPAQVLAAVNEGKTTTITHTDATHGTFKFTSFGVISTASGDVVSSSITYGTSADSLTLYTLIGDVTKGTWTLYSKNLTVSA